ncbi:DEAD/DEAH box helicase [Sphingomonas japonica]|uniref:Superfamily II DNA/RNA helicase n=1 Tax=Sphingomonas japonica TaxID=511662 RepID=A0ABX0TWI7_9SPHN|nr:DEAD/DEAH box helicase [Sphingomonas japonica]NIJ22681.1 superfamily II DNA/RNA helicase [Sphingomonas japonica]
MSFADLGLSDELLRAVEESGYTVPTPIQASAIPSVLMMRDLIAIAQTGTGKTASFVLPMIDILAQGRSRARMPRSLILEPTRELAAQVAENFEKYGKYHKLSMALLIGGVSMGDQLAALEKGVDVLIATPGRLMDLFGRGKIMLNGCSLLVIDEADRMLDMGFIPDIEEICTKLPKARQTLLFSATMPPPIKKLADKFLDNPKSIEVARAASTNANIKQYLVPVGSSNAAKRDRLRALLGQEEVRNAIIFCNRKTTVRELNKSLRQHGFKSGEIHGDMDQGSRIAELDLFKAGHVDILVASDVAARGLDIKGVSHVFNFDAPWHPDDYVHRIGRTGRAGATGIAYTFVTPDDAENIENIEKLTSQKIERIDGSAGSDDAPSSTGKRRGRAKPAAKAAPSPAPRPAKSETEPAAPSPRRSRARKPSFDSPAAAEAPSVAEASATPIEVSQPSPREERAPRRERGPRRDRAAHDEPRARRSPQRADDDGADEGWNGPVPSFLDVTLGR